MPDPKQNTDSAPARNNLRQSASPLWTQKVGHPPRAADNEWDTVRTPREQECQKSLFGKVGHLGILRGKKAKDAKNAKISI